MEAKRVQDIMTSEITTLKRNEKLTLADDVMQLGRIRHLPVLDDDGQEVVGILSQRDLFRGALALALGYGPHARPKILDTLLVKEVMTTDVITIGPAGSFVALFAMTFRSKRLSPLQQKLSARMRASRATRYSNCSNNGAPTHLKQPPHIARVQLHWWQER
jgi:CBS-domain-containing membrane protein